MNGTNPKVRRCAIYTRKSSEEGLEQDFNSLEAQREACEAYIRSQAGEGWKLIRTRYDDGGYSGGYLDRPALTRLINDVCDRKVGIVVVYKVDRLTRSLADFAKIVEVFDSHDVSFVSITQQFNTTTSMGRLTLNMLLSFAQFEREVTGERIRDKLAASKQKGMWMGGLAPLGYDAKDRTLVINDKEAETVRTLFRLYLELGDVRKVKEEADRLGLVTKVRIARDGTRSGGKPLSRGHIYKLLNNPVYIGRIVHKDTSYEGKHHSIIDSDTWEAVQFRLDENAVDRKHRANIKHPSPLAGKLFDEEGLPLTPSHAVKAGRRYRYYVSRNLVRGNGKSSKGNPWGGWRLPAHEIERAVAKGAAAFLGDSATLVAQARATGVTPEAIPTLLNAVKRLKGNFLQLVEHVDLGQGRIALTLCLPPIENSSAVKLKHTVPVALKRRGVEMRLVIEGTEGGGPMPDPALVKALARAHGWFEDLRSGRRSSLRGIAKVEGVTDRYIAHILPLAFLAPDIVESIVDGTQPEDLTLERLVKYTDLPLAWADQKALLGFTPSR